ncbi:MAG: hypothetical protein A3F68_03120 [Acidobacteria bacterium RIFCSPLOWO2_12_FULL_54_10]|nr:MAG: hypothetical protein A3F68_03120 [Acidobacteria bacterium RIFCSPLOWO2_12_FULL_54_10]
MPEGGALEKALQELVRQAVEQAVNSLRQELRGQVPAGAASPSAQTAASVSSLPAVSQGISRILQPTVQGEILTALLQSASGFAARAAILARKGDAYAMWRSEGFSNDVSNKLRTLSVPSTKPGIFKEVTESRMGVSTPRSAEHLTEPFDEALGKIADGTAYVFPVVVQGKVVAALYADSGDRPASVEPSALEILARVAGLSLETAASRAASGQPASKGATASASPAPSQEAPSPVPAPILETPAAAPAGSFASSIPAAATDAPAIPGPPDPDSLPEDQRDAHRKAHRFARVAVQDLLSYHKNKIEDGRQKKKLYAILKDDIDKTRENYQKRFGQTPAASYDYFHFELVVKLAGNDPATLGDQYPGPVSA